MASKVDAGDRSLALRTNAEGITSFGNRIEEARAMHEQNIVLPNEVAADFPADINLNIDSKHGKFRTLTIVTALYVRTPR
jgi:hypothetical protein